LGVIYQGYGTRPIRIRKFGKCSKNRKLELNETVQLNNISGSAWWQHFSSLYNSSTPVDNFVTVDEGNDHGLERIEITKFEIEKALISLKNRKASSQDDICNERFKYGGRSLIAELIKLFRKIVEKR
jgi:hypothetical protein